MASEKNEVRLNSSGRETFTESHRPEGGHVTGDGGGKQMQRDAERLKRRHELI